jgi:hypothetical protein
MAGLKEETQCKEWRQQVYVSIAGRRVNARE